VVWIAIAGLSLDFVMSNYCRYDAQKWLEKNVPAGATMGYMGDMRDMPRFNKPLDPHQCEANEDALAQAAPNVLVLSFQQGHPATGARCMRPASMALRNLGSWGRLRSRAGPRARGFFEKLVDGELGYDEIKRFESPIGPIVPQVAESANRTIVVMKRR
jgi:hypothetical protein